MRLQQRVTSLERRVGATIADCPCREIHYVATTGEHILPPDDSLWSDDWHCKRCGRPFVGIVMPQDSRGEPIIEAMQQRVEAPDMR